MLTFFFIEFRLKQYNHKQHRQVKQSIESLVEFRFSFHNPFATLSFLEYIRFLLILIFARRKKRRIFEENDQEKIKNRLESPDNHFEENDIWCFLERGNLVRIEVLSIFVQNPGEKEIFVERRRQRGFTSFSCCKTEYDDVNDSSLC